MDDQGLNSDAFFCEKIKKGMHYRHPKAVGPKPKSWKFSPFQSTVWHSKSVELPFGLRTLFRVRVPFGLFFQGFLVGPCTQPCFHPPFMIFHLFSRQFRLFKNNYIVDKYFKINLDNVQIIHDFIVNQSSFLFLCMQSYFKH